MKFHLTRKISGLLVCGIVAALTISGGLSSASANGVQEFGTMQQSPTQQPHNGLGPGGHDQNDSGHMWLDGTGFFFGDDAPSDEQTRHMMREGAKYALFSTFTYSNGVADGYFVDFLYSESSGEVIDYMLRIRNESINIFKKVTISGFEPESPVVHGSVFRVANESIQMIIHDNPTGMYHVVANVTPLQVSFRLADGVSITGTFGTNIGGGHDKKEAVIISKGDFRGIISTDCGKISAWHDGDDTIIDVVIENDHVMFRALPIVPGRNMVAEMALFNAILQNRLCCEVSVVVRNNDAAYEIMQYDHRFQVRVLSAAVNRIALELSSENHEGRLLVLTFDRESLVVQKHQTVVRIDGISINKSVDPLEVFFSSGDELDDAVYTVLHNDDVVQVLIYLPNFSTHVIEVESISIIAGILSPVGIVAIVAATAIVCVSGIMLLHARKKGG